MLDDRIYTFLKLCDTMNYRKTAEALDMTQPAVTQHIQHLEKRYKAKLFEYSQKQLSKTESGIKLEEYSRSVVYNEASFKKEIAKQEKESISIGATKTIGDYAINDLIEFGLRDENLSIEVIVDNTKHLLRQLDNFELDFLILEGYFDKTKYDYKLLRNEELVGICSETHRFANKKVPIEDVFKEHIILREKGSGTREVFTNFLAEKNYSYKNFNKTSVISSLNLIQYLAEKGLGVSFVYNSVPMSNKKLAVFRIKGSKISHEFNYVFLKNSKARGLMKKMADKIYTPN